MKKNKMIASLLIIAFCFGIVFSSNSYVEAKEQKVIAIDAGHQARANSALELIGPGASTKKAKVTSGTSGIATHLAEYKLNLIVAKKLKKELEARGYKVVMIRTTHNVNISNRERAAIANRANADAFIRIHANSSTNSGVHGVLTMSPTKNSPYVANLYSKSYQLSRCILNQVISKTGATNRGVMQTNTMSGINWSKVPVTILEMGFMSNRAEDVKLSTTSYQNKIVKGISNGLDQYFK